MKSTCLHCLADSGSLHSLSQDRLLQEAPSLKRELIPLFDTTLLFSRAPNRAERFVAACEIQISHGILSCPGLHFSVLCCSAHLSEIFRATRISQLSSHFSQFWPLLTSLVTYGLFRQLELVVIRSCKTKTHKLLDHSWIKKCLCSGKQIETRVPALLPPPCDQCQVKCALAAWQVGLFNLGWSQLLGFLLLSVLFCLCCRCCCLTSFLCCAMWCSQCRITPPSPRK